MVKFNKNKLKALKKLDKAKTIHNDSVSNKVLKKLHNNQKKVSFYKKVLDKDRIGDQSALVKNVAVGDILSEASKSTRKKKTVKKQTAQKQDSRNQPKRKPIQKKNKRQQTQINDTKLLLSLMK